MKTKITPVLIGMATYMLSACGQAPMSTPLESGAAAAEAWETQPVEPSVESPHPYANNTRVEERFEAPSGATAIRLQVRIDTEQDYDFVEFLDANKTVVQRFSGSGEGLSGEIPGRVAFVRLVSDGSVTGWGFAVLGIRFKIDRAPTPTPPPPATGDGRWVRESVGNVSIGRYGNDLERSWAIRGPSGSTKLRVHFARFDLEQGYDFVRVFDAQGGQAGEYTGKRGAFTSGELVGATARVQIVSDYSVNGAGFSVDWVEGWVPAAVNPGCSRDADCGRGRECVRRMCRDIPTRAGGNAGEACDNRSAPCGGALSCRPEQNSALGGVCAELTWSTAALAFPRATDHPYKDNTDTTFDVRGPAWAQQIKVRFDAFELEDGYDVATVLAGQRTVGRLTGRLGDVSSDPIDGNAAQVRFTSDRSVTARGFDITEVDAYGVPDTLVAVSIDPRVCTDRLPTDTRGLTAHLESLGVTVYGVRRYRFAAQTCSGCSCASGERVVLLLDAKDAIEVTRLTRYAAVFSVADNRVAYSGNLVAMVTTPKQCGSNPWERYCRTNSCGATLHGQLSAWADSVGAVVLTSHTKLERENVCEGCSCSEQHDVHIAVSAASTTKLSPHGFRTVR